MKIRQGMYGRITFLTDIISSFLKTKGTWPEMHLPNVYAFPAMFLIRSHILLFFF